VTPPHTTLLADFRNHLRAMLEARPVVDPAAPAAPHAAGPIPNPEALPADLSGGEPKP
jgi:hypothetical protein